VLYVGAWSVGSGVVVGRERRSLAYRARRLSSAEIDAFNEGLHNKRPRFIGKRRVPTSALSCNHLDAFGNCIDDDELTSTNKRAPRRKFMGKKSADTDTANIEVLHLN